MAVAPVRGDVVSKQYDRPLAMNRPAYEMFSLMRTDIVAAFCLVVIGCVVYGPFVGSTGFYWDDWPIVWVYHSFGSAGLAAYFAGNRPVFGWLFSHLFPILGTRPVGWQMLSIAVRCASSVAVFLTFCRLWPRRRDAAWTIGAILLLHAGFTQQPIAFIYLPIHISFLLFVLSLLASMFAITSTRYRWPLVMVALLMEIASYGLTEYFVGLEFLRPIMLGALMTSDVHQGFRKRTRAALISWLPYALLWAAYAIWRALLFHNAASVSHSIDVTQIMANPLHETWGRICIAIHNLLMSTLFAWTRPLSPDFLLVIAPLGAALVFWLHVAIVAVVAVYALRRITAAEEPPTRIPKAGLVLAVVGLLTSGLPFLLTNDSLMVYFTNTPSYDDRMALPFLLASSLLLFLLVDRVSRNKIPLVAAILCVLGAFQVQNEKAYRLDWLNQRSLFWQIAWRAPTLKTGTSVFVDGLPKSIYRNHNSGMLDMLYSRRPGQGLNYFMFDMEKYPRQASMNFKPGEPTKGTLRQFEFHGSTAQSLVWWISPNGTLRTVSPSRADEILHCPMLCSNIAHVSEPRDVITDAPTDPDGDLLAILGPAPAKDWLYYFQKAALARQLRQWDAIAELGDTAARKRYRPTDSSEWFPFIDGYARAHRTGTAVDISKRLLADSPDAMTPLSALWRDVIHESNDAAEIDKISEALGGDLDLGRPAKVEGSTGAEISRR